jgi:hypothetical protein
MNIIHPSDAPGTSLRAIPPLPALLAFERAATQLSFRRAARDLSLSRPRSAIRSADWNSSSAQSCSCAARVRCG